MTAGEPVFNTLSKKVTRTAHEHATRPSDIGGDLRLDGRKFYSTGVLFAPWIAVMANSDAGRGTLAFVAAG